MKTSACVPSKSFVATVALAGTLVAPLAAASDILVVPVPVGTSATVAAGDVVDLRVPGTDATIATNTSDSLRRVEADGDVAAQDFVVPAGRVLVITGLQLTPGVVGDGFNVVFVQQRQGGSSQTRRQLVARNSATQSYSFAPGIVIPAGSEIRISNRSNSISEVRADVQGYLADAN